jgi:hypothetical protein
MVRSVEGDAAPFLDLVLDDAQRGEELLDLGIADAFPAASRTRSEAAAAGSLSIASTRRPRSSSRGGRSTRVALYRLRARGFVEELPPVSPPTAGHPRSDGGVE